MAATATPYRIPRPPLPTRAATPWRALMAGCVLLAALSLLGPHDLTYDPTAWVVWGREVSHFQLVTSLGPSWKPLPVLFTAPFALLGDHAAPLLWLVVARAGGLFALVLTCRLAARIAGPWAGAIALASLLFESVFSFHFFRGNSEGLLAAAALWAIERHLDGRPWQAFALGVVAGLIRPELWTFVGLYGLYLLALEPEHRTLAKVAGAAAFVLFMWFVPELIGSGDLLRAASRALEPVPDSPGQAAHPFVAVFTNAEQALLVPTYVGAGVAVLIAAVRRDWLVLALAACSSALMLSVAAGAEIGFTGNQRYVTLPAALVCVLSGVGWVQAIRLVRGRFGMAAAVGLTALAAAAALPFVPSGVSVQRARWVTVRYQAGRDGSLDAAIAAAGGADAVKRCGAVYAQEYDTQRVAWDLHLHLSQVHSELHAAYTLPATVFAARHSPLSRDRRFTEIARTDRWIIASSCGR